MKIEINNALGFTDAEINDCLRRQGLCSIELEFTKKCNLRCLYCYSNAGEGKEHELDVEEVKSVITQAREMGAKKVVLLGGGEPLLYKDVMEVIAFINSLGLDQAIFTNGTLINVEVAEFMLSNNVSVIVKHNSFDPEVQDLLAGVKGASRNIRRGLDILLEAGYPSTGATLGIQTVICRQNIDELASMWLWARERGIIPYFEMMTYQGRARENPGLEVPPMEMKAVFEELKRVDMERFGVAWESNPPVAAFSCRRHLYSCLVDSQGYIQPCTGVDLKVGNIRKTPLRDILRESPVMNDLRNIYDKVEGKCRSCEHNSKCYGCRGNAFQTTGNYLASDPACWLPQGVQDESSVNLCKQ